MRCSQNRLRADLRSVLRQPPAQQRLERYGLSVLSSDTDKRYVVEELPFGIHGKLTVENMPLPGHEFHSENALSPICNFGAVTPGCIGDDRFNSRQVMAFSFPFNDLSFG